MSDNFQMFDSDNCDNIIPQGSVISEQRYVRTTLIEETLDEQLLTWEKSDGSVLAYPAVATIGLPLWYLSRDEGYQITSPRKVASRRDHDVFIGTDRVALPGLSNASPSQEIIKVYTEDIRNNRACATDVLDRLTKDQKQKLQRTGQVTLANEGGVPTAVRLVTRSAAGRQIHKAEDKNVATANNLAFSTHPGYIFRHMIDTTFNGNVHAAVEAFAADPRSEEFHDSSYPQNNTITELTNATFDVLFSILKMHPEWDDVIQEAPTPPLPQFSIGLVHVFKQTQQLLGFSRGRLIESVTLGPEEAVTVEVYSFDRTLEQREDTRSTEVTSEIERTRNQSQSVELSNEIENTIGASVGAELGASIPIEAVSVDASINNDISAEIATRNQNTANLLTEASSRAAEKYKANHQVKTLTRRETGEEIRTTRTFKNPNLGRTINLHHFEVIGHYETKTEVDEKPQFCILVETPIIGPFDRDWIRAHHDFLDDVLTHDAYREGLNAANVIAAQEWLDELAAAEKRAKEEEQQRLAAEAASAPADNFLPNKGIFATAKRMREKLELFLTLGTMDNAINTIADHINPFTGVSLAQLGNAEDVLSKWAWWTQFEAAYPGMGEAAKKFAGEYDTISELSSQPESADDMIAAVGEFVDRFDDDWLMGLKLFGAAYILAQLMFLPAMANPAVYLYVMKLLYFPNDKGLPKLISTGRADYAQHKAKQSAETLVPPAPPVGTLKPENLPPKPPRAYSEKELAEAHAAMGRLVLHLEKNTEHYNNEYYKREDPSLRIERLSQLGVARYAGNRLLGFAGTRSIYPLNVQALTKESRDYLDSLIPDNSNFKVDLATTKTTIPTGGFVSEAVLGQCEALEPYLVERRIHDLRTRELQNLVLEKRLAQSGGNSQLITGPVDDSG